MGDRLWLESTVSEAAGSPVIGWRPVTGGYTATERWIAELHDGTTLFVKAATDDATAAWIRDEHRFYVAVHADFLPRLLGYVDGPRPILLLEDLSDAAWSWEWSPSRLTGVLRLLKRVAATPVRSEIPPLVTPPPRRRAWHVIAADPRWTSDFLALGLVTGDWLRRALPALLEAEANASFDGEELVHGDVRGDNLCWRGDRPLLVDWNWARRGNAALDRVNWLPSVAVEGGPQPWEIRAEEPQLVAAMSGILARQVSRPAAGFGAAMRRLHLDKFRSALRWAARGLHLDDPFG